MEIVDRLTFMFESEDGVLAEVIDADGRKLRRDVMPEDLVLMQFTGLHDKNGREVYEGDVVEWQTCKPDHKDRMTVEFWVEGGGCIKTVPFLNASSTVIGNIYENPELLESR